MMQQRTLCLPDFIHGEDCICLEETFDRPVWESSYVSRELENGRRCSESGEGNIFLVEPEGKRERRTGGNERVRTTCMLHDVIRVV